MWISLGNHAKLALVFAQTDPALRHKGLACFLVETDQPGYQPSEIKGKMGLWASRHRRRSRSTTSSPAPTRMLGQVGDGFKVAMSALDSGRYSVAAGCVGICQASVEESVKYAKERHAFERPIASLPARAGDDRRHGRAHRRGADARLPRRRAQGRGPALDDRDLDRQVLRHRGRVLVRRPRHPGPRRRRLRRRPPGRALLPRRARDHALRGHVADPEAHHRPGGDRDQRAGPVLGGGGESPTRRLAGWRAGARPGTRLPSVPWTSPGSAARAGRAHRRGGAALRLRRGRQAVARSLGTPTRRRERSPRRRTIVVNRRDRRRSRSSRRRPRRRAR